MPRIESYRNKDERSSGYMVTQYFGTQIIPQNDTSGPVNDRIFIIDGVADA
jgi:hypothetical protein